MYDLALLISTNCSMLVDLIGSKRKVKAINQFFVWIIARYYM